MTIQQRFTQLCITGLLLLCCSAWAIDLDSAKQQGAVGEMHTGYLGVIDSANGDIKQLVEAINQKRKQQYQKIAQSNNIELQQVELLAGKKAITKTAAGHYIKLEGSEWRKK